MKIICSKCNTSNDSTNAVCSACTSQLELNWTSKFQLENGRMLSIVNLLNKVEQLEKRLIYVEENYRPTNLEKIPKATSIEDEKPVAKSIDFVVPSILPTTLNALKSLLEEVNAERKAAKKNSNYTLFTRLAVDAKKIERRIQQLEEQRQKELDGVESKQKEIRKSYPKSIKDLETMLRELAIQKELANANKDIKGLEEFLKEEKIIKKHLENLKLEELYGKSEKENIAESDPIDGEKTLEEVTVNKHIIYEIKRELASIWNSKQRAELTQDVVRFRLLSDKETKLKEELALAEQGKIQARLKPAFLETSTKEEVVEIKMPASSKTVKKQPVAVKVVKPKREGPTALEQFFAPLISAVSFVENKYNEYKKEGKLSLFFLTVAGIVTLLFGFGFLAQYSAVTYFGNYLTQIKVGFGFACSCAAISIGIRLIKKDKKFEEFGAALMGLGLSLNYLFIYFLSADPPLITPTIGFVLIILNTAVSVVLSLRYESKIIAVLALLGGALAPSYLQSTGENTHIYFAYLWLLCGASAYVAKRLSWEVLNIISFLLVVLILGSSTYLNYTDVKKLPDTIYLMLFHAFAYLYAYLSLFDGLQPRKEQSAISLITLIGAQAAMMMSLYFVYGNQQEAYSTLSLAYLLNMLPFAGITIAFYGQWSNAQKSILIGISSAFVAAAIPAFFGVEYRGLLWALQGIVLLSGGLIFKLSIVRRMGYSIVLGGLANMLFNLDWSSMPDRTIGVLFTAGYINLWSIGIVLIVVSVLLKKYEERLEDHEQKVPIILNEVLAIWGVFVFYITTYFFFENYAYNLALIPMFALLLWNNYRKLYVAEILGLLQGGVLFLVILISMDRVNSYHFSDQMFYGQLGMLEVLFVLWFMKLFYAKMLPESPAYKHNLATRARELFYVILPICLLDTFHHGFSEYILYGFWGITLFVFILAEYTKSKAVLFEFLGFTFISMFLSCTEIHYGTLILGNVILLGIGFYKKAWTEAAFDKFDYQMLYIAIPYFFILSVGLIYFEASTEDLFSTIFLIAAGLLTLVNLGSTLAPVRRTLSIAYRLGWVGAFLGLGYLFLLLSIGESMPNSIFIGMIGLGVVLGWSHKMIYKADIPYRGDQQSALWQIESIVLHVLNIASYSTILFLITDDPTSLALTIVLFMHGIALVFNGLSPNFSHLNKVYIPLFGVAMIKLFLVDMKDAETIMKIIVFIVVGVICLLAAYFLIKYNSENKTVATTTNSIVTDGTEEENDPSENNEN